MFYWVLKSIVLGPLLRALFRPWVTGLENVPEKGPAILVSNHLSFSDSFFLPLVVPRRITFLAKADYFTGRGVKGRLTAGFFRVAGQVPVDRSGAGAGDAALSTGLKVLAAGDLLGIYPEGTRSPDGRLYRGKTGVARMALEGHVPVIPVAMVGTDKVQPIGQKVPNLGRVGVKIGAPLDFSRYEGMESDRLVLRSITDEVMYELMKLSGQEYVDVYAATMRAQITEAMRERIAIARARAQAAAATAASRAAEARARIEAARDEAVAARQQRSVDLSEFPEDDPHYDPELDVRRIEGVRIDLPDDAAPNGTTDVPPVPPVPADQTVPPVPHVAPVPPVPPVADAGHVEDAAGAVPDRPVAHAADVEQPEHLKHAEHLTHVEHLKHVEHVKHVGHMEHVEHVGHVADARAEAAPVADGDGPVRD